MNLASHLLLDAFQKTCDVAVVISNDSDLRVPPWDGYRRKIDRHILPVIGKVPIRRLRVHHLEALYDRMLHPTDGQRALAAKTVLEVHLIIRGALDDAVRRGVVSRNVALVAHAPKLKSIPKVEQKSWNA